ncbi:S-layer homology domain-containing protein [Solibacillus silvestris]|uniref:S-layer homology domain-containing protein n=1 Tax=Solibacillus silvestris TaxID=76853 RepID=UPI003F814D04
MNGLENHSGDLSFNLFKGDRAVKNLDYLAHAKSLSFDRKHLTEQLPPGSYTVSVADYGSREQFNRVDYDIAIYELLFSDVTTKNMYIHEITALSKSGMIMGHADGIFQPKNNITRRQVLTMLSRDQNLSLPPMRKMKDFKDVKANSSAYDLIKPFYEAGIIDGSDTEMNLASPLTRAQLAKILVNAYQLKMRDNAAAFKDASSNEYIRILASNGITTGSNGYFAPNKPVTREHFSVFLYWLYNME